MPGMCSLCATARCVCVVLLCFEGLRRLSTHPCQLSVEHALCFLPVVDFPVAFPAWCPRLLLPFVFLVLVVCSFFLVLVGHSGLWKRRCGVGLGVAGVSGRPLLPQRASVCATTLTLHRHALSFSPSLPVPPLAPFLPPQPPLSPPRSLARSGANARADLRVSAQDRHVAVSPRSQTLSSLRGTLSAQPACFSLCSLSAGRSCRRQIPLFAHR